ncbi:MAG: right-handed parallel beta-helix repeat-containing protein [Anaerolineaceae bacterium]|nr:right-handed parallel beta-helix repeat-containing protein [Anaerolineaceae bacterium]
MKNAKPGYVVCIMPGTYHERLGIMMSGTEDKPIVIMGIGGRPVIDGSYLLPPENTKDFSPGKLGCPGTIIVPKVSSEQEGGQFLCTGYAALVGIYGSNIVLENIEVTRSTGPGVAAYSATGMSNLVIRNVYVHSVRQNGIDLHNVSHVKIDHNEVSDSGNFAPFHRPGAALEWGAGVSGFGVHFGEFTSNVIHNNWGDALLVDTNTGKSSDLSISGNIFYDNYSSNGVYAHAVKNVSVQNNLFYCSAGVEMSHWSSTLIAPAEAGYSEDIDTNNIVVSNNIYANCPNAGIVLWDTKHNARTISNVSIVNNTFLGEPNPKTASGGELSGFKGVTMSNNLKVEVPDATSTFAGSTFLTGQNFFAPGAVKASWFAIKHYKGVGADTSSFAAAGLF